MLPFCSELLGLLQPGRDTRWCLLPSPGSGKEGCSGTAIRPSVSLDRLLPVASLPAWLPLGQTGYWEAQRGWARPDSPLLCLPGLPAF